MPKTIAALYDSRAEAEYARSALVSDRQARSARIIAKDTLGALDGLDIASSDKESYREGLRQGGHLLVAEAASGANPQLIVDLLEEAVGRAADPGDQWGDSAGVRVQLPADEAAEQPAAINPSDEPAKQPERSRRSQSAEHSRRPWFEEQLRHGREDMPPAGGARVRTTTRDAVAEEQVTLRDDLVSVERRPADRSLTEDEIESGGLFKERVFEIAEMREEPVVTKVAVVHEEVIVRKTVKERTETVRDTVRQTQIEVEDMPEPEGAPAFFGQPKRV
jgi:stress response protein YsnF